MTNKTADEILLKMAEARKRFGLMPKPLPEIRIHPDDYNELRQFSHVSPDTPSFWGVPVSIDEDAPRLLTKKEQR